MLQLVLLAALPFIWFGMVAAISFLETPLKFKAPGITIPLAVGIGRIVFKALNMVEALLAVALLAAAFSGPRTVPAPAAAAIAVAVLALAVQLLLLRPRMERRTRLLAQPAVGGGTEAKASTASHIGYVVVEMVKIIALPVAGVAVLLAVL